MARLSPPDRRTTLILLTPGGDGVWYGPGAPLGLRLTFGCRGLSRIALKLDEFPGMKFYWREGHSSLLHTPDMLSRALYEYDGSKLPEQNGYAGPFEYRDCPVFNVLNESLW